MNPHPHIEEAERKAVNRVIAERRDVRRGSLDAPVPADLIGRLLTAAHSAPSVGQMQPSRFIVIWDYGIRKGVHRIFEAAKRRALDCYNGEQAERYSELKLEEFSKRRKTSAFFAIQGASASMPSTAKATTTDTKVMVML